MQDGAPVRGVHLVGSIALASPRRVFEEAGALFGERLKRVPDGEPGGRNLWISWQYPLLRANPFLKVDESADLNPASGFRRLTLVDDVPASGIAFGELGYAREARASYIDFRRARDAGQLPPGCRFQVCLPTPLACLFPFISRDALPAVEPAYQKAMLGELQVLFEEIPHRDLALQWDVCVEMVLWDGRSSIYVPPWPGAVEKHILSRMATVCASIPTGVDLGFHLCYGDWEARHFIEPVDMGKMVEVANGLKAVVPHPIAYVHMPVPIARSDDEYFKPLAGLALDRRTEIYLGLIHLQDGVPGARRRMEAAQKYVKHFGLATECGLGRCKTPDVVSCILQLHAEVCASG